MCLVALFYRVVADAPVVLGANREEFYRRGGEPPAVRPGPVHWLAGLDPVAGGTWMGVNAHGLLVAVTNRRRSQPPAQPHSRGLLVRRLLQTAGAAEATEAAVQALQHDPYDGCNLLCVDAQRALVIQAGDWLRVRPLPPGLHVLANGDLNDPADPRVAHVLAWLGQQPHDSAAECVAALRQVCAHREPEYPNVCIRLPERGTVSSTIVVLHTDEAGRIQRVRSVFLHAQGAPDQVPYVDQSRLLRELMA
jgi:uncharacterized protein with NRDE domain